MEKCSFEGCGNTRFGHFLICKGHYTQSRKGQTLRPLFKRNQGAECTFEGCALPAHCRLLCKGHYRQQWQGKPLVPLHPGRRGNQWVPNEVTVEGDVVRLALTNRAGVVVGHALVDLEDLVAVRRAARWHVTREGYVRYVRDRNAVWLHRFLTDCPEGMEVDHINGDRLDNRRGNLRIVTRAENAQNIAHRGRAHLRGVSWDDKRAVWQVDVTVHGVRVVTSRFRTLREARKAARAGREAHFTHNVESRHQG